jgi:putative transcriptional regulator
MLPTSTRQSAAKRKMEARKLYNRIAVLRKEREVSRQDLAQEIGVNFQTVGYLEREEYNPSLDLAFRISEYFDLPVELVFSTRPQKPLSQELLERQREQERQHGT